MVSKSSLIQQCHTIGNCPANQQQHNLGDLEGSQHTIPATASTPRHCETAQRACGSVAVPHYMGLDAEERLVDAWQALPDFGPHTMLLVTALLSNFEEQVSRQPLMPIISLGSCSNAEEGVGLLDQRV